jgi:hypothetical protein
VRAKVAIFFTNAKKSIEIFPDNKLAVPYPPLVFGGKLKTKPEYNHGVSRRTILYQKINVIDIPIYRAEKFGLLVFEGLNNMVC